MRLFKPLSEDVLLCVVADGMGSQPSTLQPAAIASIEVVEACERLYKKDSEVFLENATMMLQEGLYVGNRVLGAFKISNEEKYSGFGCSITAVLVYHGNKFAFAHAGNTRLSLIRTSASGNTNIHQITEEHTVAMDLFLDGVIDSDGYYAHPDRYKLTSGLGMFKDVEMQLYDGKLKKGDILLITTDGVHYGIRPEYLPSCQQCLFHRQPTKFYSSFFHLLSLNPSSL